MLTTVEILTFKRAMKSGFYYLLTPPKTIKDKDYHNFASLTKVKNIG